ncbi:unnamed protein product [Chrysodeixis includens]|uniref:DUF4794 domain-containing protein n=1 Tax=Chrysodeixis includens TaxID=689277 RepID=A0A9P0BRC0_CHRIL|nr:unnamed protein product [Chrysodeixis includens]
MQSFVCVLLLAAIVAAEPLSRQRYRFQRQELGSGYDNEATTQSTDDAPYAPAGFRPAKVFNLPTRQEAAPPSTSYGVPDDSYGAPLNTYVAPQVEYGVPEKSPATEYGVPETDDNEGSGKEEEKVEAEKENIKEEPKSDAEVVSAQGVYYVLLPGSQLQRVQFQTENDVRNMAYTARLQYKNEDRAPLYVYTAVPQYQSAAYVQLF